MFSISSPTITRRAGRMAATPIGLVAREAAVITAAGLRDPLREALRRAGSPQVARAVRVYDGHLNDLVMRQQGSKGDVIVGVGGDSKYADQAEELEWGGLGTSPVAWVRTTVAQRATQVTSRWSNELTRELDRRYA